MKNYLFIWIAIAGVILSGCSKEETEIRMIGDDDSTYLNVLLGTPLTYAGFDATDEEKALHSVAFFIETSNGDFHRYFSHQNNFESLNINNEGNICALTLKIAGTNPGGKAQLVIIGNYVENGLTDVLSEATSLQELLEMQSKDIADYPIVSPFLAYHEPVEVTITGGAINTEHFILKRLAARVDLTITYLTNGVEKDPTTLAYLPEVKFFSPKKKSYLLPSSDQAVSEIPQETVVKPIVTVNAKNMTLTYYTYENSELDAVPLLIRVLFLGTNWQDISLVVKDGDDKPVIRRNHYYSPEIHINYSGA